MDLKLNFLHRDEFGRPHGVLAVNKPAGITSHDVVNKVRRALNIRQVGHAGALDPFATGLIIILVGKATKLSDKFLNSDKEYLAKILFGVSTNSADIEGEITGLSDTPPLVTEQLLTSAFAKFIPEYDQYVPVFSSVKVNGQKLRVVARSTKSFSFEDRDGIKYAVFINADGSTQEIALPHHRVQISKLEVAEVDENYDIQSLEFYQKNQAEIKFTALPVADVTVACSKGTYIRTLAEDIGNALPTPTPSMLINLQRTRIEKITLEHALELDSIPALLSVPPAPSSL